MKKINEKIKNKSTIAISQIFILVLGIIAISYAIGSEVRVVSGQSTRITIKGAVWELTADGRNWKCISNCVDTATGIDYTNSIKNLCTHYQRTYLITNAIPAGNCDAGYFKLIGTTEKTTEEDAGEEDTTKEKITNLGATIKQASAAIPADTFPEGAWAGIREGEEEYPEYKCTSGEIRYHKCVFVCPDKTVKCECKNGVWECQQCSSKCAEDAGTEDGKEPGKIKAPWGLAEKIGNVGYFLGHLAQGAIWAVGIFTTIKMVGPMLGLEESLVNAAAWALSTGVLVGKITIGVVQWWSKGAKVGTLAGFGVGAAVTVAIFLATYRKETQEIITFTCQPWDANTGGSNCEKCNEQGILPCSEYQCRSLGQACELVNKGTDEEKCVWVNRNDINFPTIEAWKDALISNDYKYKPDNSISPPDKGVIIEYEKSTDKCVPAFTPLSFGIKTDEPAKCKLDVLRKDKFEEMDFYFSGGLLLSTHSYALSLPGSDALEAEGITVENDGEYEIYVRCQDANGNFNTANFVFKFCVEKGPDTTPPLIAGTSIESGMPIAHNQTSIDIEVYVNEPADCKWSHLDQSYDSMGEDMSCSSSIFEMNAQMLYKCSTTLTGLKDKQENKFYFRCKDQAGNAKEESYEYILIGTQPLVIDFVKPEGLIKDSTESVKVTLEARTSAGYKEGESTCYYSDTGNDGSYIMFFDTSSYQHFQDLWLAEDTYEYFIKCIDLSGNTDTAILNFEVETDTDNPIIVRVYREDTYLKLVTNEPARCVYDTKYEYYPCDYLFDDGTPMNAIDDVEHYTDWNTQTTFYIVCQDEYGNQPAPNKCSKIIRPFETY